MLSAEKGTNISSKIMYCETHLMPYYKCPKDILIFYKNVKSMG